MNPQKNNRFLKINHEGLSYYMKNCEIRSFPQTTHKTTKINFRLIKAYNVKTKIY